LLVNVKLWFIIEPCSGADRPIVQAPRQEQTMAKDERLELLAQVASMYYDEGKTQQQIAQSTGYSRSAISRLLNEAFELGVVEIKINFPFRRATDLENHLCQNFGLQSARVVVSGNLTTPQRFRLLGRAGAAFLEEQLPDQGVLGISWGTAVFEVIQSLRTRSMPGIQVVQMIGAVGQGDPSIDGPELAQSLARTLGTRYTTLHAPLIVDDALTRNALLGERGIRDALELARCADIALVGIGSVRPELSSLVRAGYLDHEELLAIQHAGAVGDICATHYDQKGQIIDLDLNQRVVGLGLQNLADNSGMVIAVAGGAEKTAAISGALKGGFLDVLVTDNVVAEALLNEHLILKVT
jgi:deoxyribonucleoside regulator